MGTSKDLLPLIPMSILGEIIQEWRVGYEMAIETPNYGNSPSRNHGQMEWLQEASGIPHRRISDIIRGYSISKKRVKGGEIRYSKGTNVSFAVADKLLCAMNLPQEWHHRLKDYYGPIPVGTWEKHREDNK